MLYKKFGHYFLDVEGEMFAPYSEIISDTEGDKYALLDKEIQKSFCSFAFKTGFCISQGVLGALVLKMLEAQVANALDYSGLDLPVDPNVTKEGNKKSKTPSNFPEYVTEKSRIIYNSVASSPYRTSIIVGGVIGTSLATGTIIYYRKEICEAFLKLGATATTLNFFSTNKTKIVEKEKTPLKEFKNYYDSPDATDVCRKDGTYKWKDYDADSWYSEECD